MQGHCAARWCFVRHEGDHKPAAAVAADDDERVSTAAWLLAAEGLASATMSATSACSFILLHSLQQFGRSTPKAARITRKVLPKLGRTEAPLLVSDARLYPSPRGWITVTNLIAAGH